ncbi:MAG: SET domain-containing protein [Patescibacteria group bacterium]
MPEMKRKPKRTFSWMNPKLEARTALKYGKDEKGVFAKEDIKKGEMLAIFGGYIMTLDKENKSPKKYRDTGVQIAKNFVISSKNKKEDTDCFNHSCNPNAGFNGQIFLVAIENINKNEEVVFDYAMVLFGNNPKESYTIKCICSSNRCRRIITEKDWKIPELQKKYDGYFQYFLQEKINKLKEK